MFGDIHSRELGTDIKSIFIASFTLQQTQLSGSTASNGWWSLHRGSISCGWCSSCSTTAEFWSVESSRLGTFRASTFSVWFFDGDADLALIEKLGSICVFVDVSFLSRHQISGIFQIIQQEFVESAAFLVQDLNSVTVTIINGARMNDGTEGVGCF
jgi:hypothetical protein